ncbi:hemolysin D [Helicobacter sp. 12S02232-10]|uniref:HlyD family efflux transporter periplasmic adaptor subunit n=1 Tax=Helicobacter sp. 12S02232-10 TaxID=1476197 RepID=UPI000BA6205F|nr:HlyD family efflux transporter periplasmic adaptor subunit [Helicobacter sp. 12S02232-10]PAF48304.1 hemolysin D [Helicobacter sp. 12S02232-10]
MKKILILAILIGWCLGEDFSLPTIKVIQQEIAPSKRYYALLQPDESRIYSQNVRFEGFVEKLYANKTYLKVKKGEKLFSVYSPELINAQGELLASLRFNEQIGAIKEKLRLLGIPKNEIESIIKNRKIKNSIEISSNFDGVIFTKNISEGGFIKRGDELFKIIDLSHIWVVAKINQEDLEFLKHSQKAMVKVEGIPNKFQVTLENINPQIGLNDKFIEARFGLENQDSIFYPNMFAKIEIFGESKKRLVLPKDAVLIKNNQAIVFKKDDFGFTPINIEVKQLSNGDYEILQGLKLGDEVAKNALFILDADAQNNGDY